MKAWRISSFGIDALQLEGIPRPKPGPREALVRIHAVSLNYRDLLVVRGQYNPKMALPRIPCSDGAGEVVEVGGEVTRIALGQRVAGIFMQNWMSGPPDAESSRGALGGDIDGVLAEYALFPEQGLIAIPQDLSYDEAAALPCAGVTAWNAIFHAGRIKAGDTVLIQGTGGVSIFALQFSKMAGARVLGTSSSDAKLERAAALGLDEGVNYKCETGWAEWVLERTGRRGADLIVETGGAGTLNQSLRALRTGGTIAQIGVLSSSGQPIEIASLLHRQARIQGIYVGSRADFEEMNCAIEQNRLRPVIDKTYPFERLPEALRAMERGSHFGKIVIQVVS